MPGSCCGASASAVSEDGTVVVGMSSDANMHNHAFRWTQAKRMQELPMLTDKGYSAATGVSADGKTLVGIAGGNCCDWLSDVGVNTTGINFYTAFAATANGNGVVGQLTNGDAYLALVKANHAATPTYSPKPGTYKGRQQVTINDTAPTATIYYTTDGSKPTTSSTVYTGPISVSVTTTIKSSATVSGYPQSPVATGVYKIK